MQGKLETRVGIFVLATIGIFIYLGFRIGAFRLDRRNYHDYYVVCGDVDGLSLKADVKIAGVKVGWVESIALHDQAGCCVQVHVMISKKYILYRNAQALIRQEGILGPKYVEIMAGDSRQAPLLPNQCITTADQQSLSVDEMMKQMQRIMVHVERVTDTMQELFTSASGVQQIKSILDSLQVTSQTMAGIVSQVDHRQQDINNLITLGSHMHKTTDAIQNSIELLTGQAEESLCTINSVAQKIDNGTGSLGKLINDDQTYKNLDYVIGGLKQYFNKLEDLDFVFDSRVENMLNRAENYEHADTKSFFDIRLYPCEDYFYLFQAVTSEKGFAYRKQIDHHYINNCDQTINTQALDLPDWARLAFVANERKDIYKRYTVLFGFQFGKIIRNFALRFGIFEGTPGAAIDVDLPFRTDYFRWVTTFEIFDMRGWNRKEDRRAHLKWLNRLYMMRNVYAVFGADDIISKHNANFFFGVGVRFGDDEVKYLLSSI